ncbi:sigma-54 interaction domain-containing protein [Cupriavidus lacunae]|uniref:Sigma-54-dependent Fis family transcriptional regulator n=1 Tax=Cupriavidus lacunae TaxID=2666307 RepID=A0A370NQ65_9BURK|nr:sigma 54-interacting transcriptional regulator [Cupriavidus lacunae]RDK07776.1 sigma-54-dependent Fis family transcriptional regulator [Cupriavidus lacunae]
MSILLAWLGNTDLRASESPDSGEGGPILGAIKAMGFDVVHLLSDHSASKTRAYARWLECQTDATVSSHQVKLTSPTSFEEIFKAATPVIEEVRQASPTTPLTFHLSPGTPAMAAIWLLLAKTRYPARLIESSREQGVKEVSIPFELSAEFVPASDKTADEALTRLMQGLPPESPAFTAIIHRCAAMKRTVAMAHRLALREVPVLIQGESGTGKELFARAIHQASVRSGRPFVAVNCGAIPQELVDAELFGHEKGAFTGAASGRAGYFEAAEGGTLFLDEIGELPLASQVRLLRVLQEREVTRVGATKAKPIDIRVIAATNRVLPDEIRKGHFREDLFHRLAVGVLLLPPLRQREGDLGLLIESILASINAEASTQPGFKHKKLDIGAKNLMIQHSWPGNVRELHNTLLRASIWATGDRITAQDVAESLAVTVPPSVESVLGRPLDHAISLPEIIGDVARHYLERAMALTHGNKSEAARLLGLGSYQTLSNWLQKYGG